MCACVDRWQFLRPETGDEMKGAGSPATSWWPPRHTLPALPHIISCNSSPEKGLTALYPGDAVQDMSLHHMHFSNKTGPCFTQNFYHFQHVHIVLRGIFNHIANIHFSLDWHWGGFYPLIPLLKSGTIKLKMVSWVRKHHDKLKKKSLQFAANCPFKASDVGFSHR